MGIALRIVVVVAWAFAVWAVLYWLQSAAAWIGLLAATVAVGAAVGRWWVLAAPFGLALVWTVAGSFAPDGSDDWNTGSYATVGVIAAVAFALALAIGVGLHQLLRPGCHRTAPR